MLEKLRRRIVAINSIFIGIILAVICFVSFHNSKMTIEEGFQNNFSNISNLLQNKLFVSLSENRSNYSMIELINLRDIFSFEKENNVTVFLFDNSKLINSTFENNNDEIKYLLDKSVEQIEKIKMDDSSLNNNWSAVKTEVQFHINFEDSNYIAQYNYTPVDTINYFEIIIIQNTDYLDADLINSFTLYLMITIISFVLIFILNNFFAKKAILPALRAQQSQKEFLACASHELKSPLAVIQSSAELIGVDMANQKEYVNNIISESQRMNNLVSDMFLLSGLEVNGLNLTLKSTDTEALLISVYEKFLPISKKSKCNLSIELPTENLPFIMADEDQILQVLFILLNNSFSYCPIGSNVKIVARRNYNKVCISIVDNGGGVSDKNQVFEKFYREEKSHTDKNHFGLGLSIGQEILKNHNSIILLTDSVGGGATFSFSLPII